MDGVFRIADGHRGIYRSGHVHREVKQRAIGQHLGAGNTSDISGEEEQGCGFAACLYLKRLAHAIDQDKVQYHSAARHNVSQDTAR